MSDLIDSFEKLQDFINSRKNDSKHLQSNYQPLVIKTLLENNGKYPKEHIDAILIKENDYLEEDKTPQTPVFEVLEKSKVIEPIKDKLVNLYYKNSSDTNDILINLCDEWIDNATDGKKKLEKLVEQFSKNRKCFDLDRLEIDEIEKLRKIFVEDFSKEKISKLKLDEFVDGIIDPVTNKSKKDTFCSRIFSDMKPFGSIIMPGGKSIFGVWMITKTQEYNFNRNKYDSPEDTLEKTKQRILELLDAGEKLDIDAIQKNTLQRFFRSKILSIYFPESFLSIHSGQAIEKIIQVLHLFSKDEIKEKSFFELRQEILKYKNNDEKLKSLNIYDFNHILWQLFKKSKVRRPSESDKIIEELEQFEDEDVPKTQLQVLAKFQKKRGKNLPSYKIRGLRKKDEKSPLMPDADVENPHYMHNLVKGVYKPANSDYAQSIMLNPNSRWDLEIDRAHTTLKINYDFEDSTKYRDDMSYLKKCMDNEIPIGILFRLDRDKYKCLGLGIISTQQDTKFVIESFGISEEESTKIKEAVIKEYDSITQDPSVSKIENVNYNQLFSKVNFHKIYDENALIEKFQGEPRKTGIPNIIDLCESGEWTVPDFQRFFDWDKNMVKNFLNSIFHGYYVGSLLLWENTLDEKIGVTAIHGVKKENEDLKKNKIVLDGQQRITSLYYAIKSPDYSLQGENENSYFYIDFGEFFSTKESKEVIKVFSKEIDPEDCYSKILFPFNKLISYKDWIRKYRAYVSESYPQLSFEQEILPLCEAIEQKLDYIKEKFKIPFINLEKVSFEDVVEIFVRINTTGKRLDPFDLLIAILSRNEIELRSIWNKAYKEFPKIREYFEKPRGSTKGLYVMQSMALSFSKSKSCKNRDIHEIFKNTSKDKDDFVSKWKEMLSYTNDAIMHIESTSENGFGVISRNWLPFEPMIPVLASLLRYIEKEAKTSKKEAYERLSYWYWISVFSNAYSKSVDARKTSDYNAVTKWIETDVIPEDYQEFRQVFFSTINLKNEKNKRSSIFRGVLSLLALKGAKDWAENRAVLNQTTFKQNKVDVDHIFPKSKYEDEPYNESILNKTWLAKATNEWMKKAKEPATYLQETTESNFKDNVNEFKETLETHFINNDAYLALLENNSEKFIEERNNEILIEITKRIGSSVGKEKFENTLLKPKMDFDNELIIENTLQKCQEYVKWYDGFFRSKGLKWLRYYIDTQKVKEIKILTGIATVDEKLRDSFKNFKNQMKLDSISCELRVIDDNKLKSQIHGRWIITKTDCFTTQSVDTISRGSYDRIEGGAERPPFDDWWDNSLDIVNDWNKIQEK